jgi:hypothetical protein
MINTDPTQGINANANVMDDAIRECLSQTIDEVVTKNRRECGWLARVASDWTASRTSRLC